MENKKEFKEGVESYRKRLINELRFMNSSIDGFVDSRNNLYDIKHLIQNYRGSLEKCNLYLSEMEVIVEERIKDWSKDLVDRTNKFIEAATRDTNEQEEPTSIPSQERNG